MKTLYLDCGMGAAGDMLTAALLELLPEPEAFVEKLNALGIPGVNYTALPSEKCGILGTHVAVTVHGEEEGGSAHPHGHHHDHAHEHAHDHPHDHAHDPPHDHVHGSMHDVEHIVRGHLAVPEEVADDILAVYKLIAEAESAVHGVPVTDVHFHEVGTLDALADVTAVCLLMRELAPDQVIASPVHVGSGTVRCAHGILPVPAPATAHILRGVPIYGGAVRGELCTPTGAALLRRFVTRFGEMPVMRVSAAGYGMGNRDFEQANCVRALLGETEDRSDTVLSLSCNVDDMTGEELGFAMEELLSAGALDAWAAPVTMKKSRPGTVLTVLCRPEDREKTVHLMFRHTATLGIRESELRRYVLERETVTEETGSGPVRIKRSRGWGVQREKAEFEDLARVARERGISLRDVRRELEGK